MQIQLYNSLTKRIEQFTPLLENKVRMYSCGPTVYNYAHIGNMRSFLFADLLQRVLRTIGKYDVKWVMNITNIDDKTIRGSAPDSPEWLSDMGEQSDNLMDNLIKFTNFYEKKFIEDISKLGINPKHFDAIPKATKFIPQMQSLIQRIVERGFGYVSEGSVYFNLAEWRKIDIYGKLFKIDFENFRAGTRIDSDQYEREQASDFVLWKARKDGEPFWKFKINDINCDGRPGWHIECSAMEYELLGLPFDIHTGGVDLKFPHHEDEIAQSKAGYGTDPTAFWCHNEFLEVDGEKMSKSKGNFYTLNDLAEMEIDPLDIRFSMFSSHYASTYNFTFDSIKAARKARLRIQDYIYEIYDSEEVPTSNIITNIEKMKSKVFSELANDLHTPKALAHLFTFINSHPPKSLSIDSKRLLKEFFRDFDDIFGVFNIGNKPADLENIPPVIIDFANLRLEARKNRNFNKADEYREKIYQAGYMVKDTKNGFDLYKI